MSGTAAAGTGGPRDCGPVTPLPRAVLGLLAGAVGGLLLTWLRVPAGTLVGAVLGSAAAGTVAAGTAATGGGVRAGGPRGRGFRGGRFRIRGGGLRGGGDRRSPGTGGGRPNPPGPDGGRYRSPSVQSPGPGDPSPPRRQHPLQHWARTGGLVLIGCVSAARLDGRTLRMMGFVALPVLAGVALLLVLDAVLARRLMKRHGLDATTAVLACAPGGLSELSVLAVTEGADVATVTVVHLVRVLSVVLVVLPLLVFFLGRSA